jgi:crotonobetainyl-CoA:carnitine CoA-transferase CaiB-like acyl-CoA transferase
MRTGILEGLRVLDFTRVVAGPFTTRVLGDFGAEVIKIQSKKIAVGIESDSSPYFSAWNRNKKSITLDMNRSEARELFLGLAESSDVVVENFSPRVMSNWQLDYDKLRQVNERLIMLSMSGMGQSGPWKDYVAFGPTVQSLAGLTYLTSYSEDAPIGLGYAYADIVSGLYGSILILAALQFRDQTDQGQYIDLSEYEAICTTMGPALMDAFVNQKEISPKGNADDYIQAAPYGCYRCLGYDKWCVIAVFTEAEWQAFRSVLGNPAWATDDNFSTLQKRLQNVMDLDSHVADWMAKQTAERVAERLQEAGVPAALVENAEELAEDPQLLSNDFFDSLSHPVLGDIRIDTYPMKFRNYQKTSWKASPLLGEANEYVFGEILGMDHTTIQSYIQKGIIS